MMVIRVGYIIAIITGFIMMTNDWQSHPALTLLKIIIGLLVNSSLEVAFAHKRHHQLSIKSLLTILVLLVGVVAVGLYLTQGRPL
ncbi:DUF1516 family protein [Fructilactobacillus carniphilus]|uniref:YisL family protein n=1 Tax=Fructilactobacillus carniphilus TaxID=2940297 RepID=A0ABY5BWS7_9LACO|nr:DUF1516 family protein [Fructilactobacillus carniphilus]USS90951.1 YisL family protein [Fructilactobacillus carniphilus]